MSAHGAVAIVRVLRHAPRRADWNQKPTSTELSSVTSGSVTAPSVASWNGHTPMIRHA
jgi:hypothetical protein